MNWGELESKGRLAPGDIILSSNPATAIAKAINLFQAFLTGKPSAFSHVQRYAGSGRIISQDWTHRVKPIDILCCQRVRIWHNPKYSKPERRRLVEESRQYLGSRYDWLGIAGQAGAGVIVLAAASMAIWEAWQGNWDFAAIVGCLTVALASGGRWLLRRVLHFPWRTYCSERVTLTEQIINPEFMDGRTQVSPAEINRWLQRQEQWLTTTIEPMG